MEFLKSSDLPKYGQQLGYNRSWVYGGSRHIFIQLLCWMYRLTSLKCNGTLYTCIVRKCYLNMHTTYVDNTVSPFNDYLKMYTLMASSVKHITCKKTPYMLQELHTTELISICQLISASLIESHGYALMYMNEYVLPLYTSWLNVIPW